MLDVEGLIKGNLISSSNFNEESEIIRLAIEYRIEEQVLNLLRKNNYKFHSAKNKFKIQRSSNSRTLKTLKIISCAAEINEIFYGKKNIYFLKGFYLTNCLYKKRSLRPINDIDIYIPSSTIMESYENLLKNGFHKKKVPIMESEYHLPALYRNNDSIKIDVHHSIFDANLDEQIILEDNKETTLFGKNYNFLSDEINFMHIIFHATKKESLDVGFQYLFDLRELIDQNLNWAKVRKLITLLNLKKEVNLTAELLLFYFEVDIRREIDFVKPPDEIIAASRTVLKSFFISTNFSKIFFKEKKHLFRQVESNAISGNFLSFPKRLIYLIKNYMFSFLKIRFNKKKLDTIKYKEKLYKFFNDA